MQFGLWWLLYCNIMYNEQKRSLSPHLSMGNGKPTPLLWGNIVYTFRDIGLGCGHAAPRSIIIIILQSSALVLVAGHDCIVFVCAKIKNGCVSRWRVII